MGSNFCEHVDINLYRLQEDCLKGVLEEAPLRLRRFGGRTVVSQIRAIITALGGIVWNCGGCIYRGNKSGKTPS